MGSLSLFAFDERAAAVDALHAMTALYTVSPVVDELLDQISWPDLDGRLLDPSAGDGMFLVRAINRLEIRKDRIEDLDRVRGWEIHPHAVAAGRTRIAEHLSDRGWTQGMAAKAAQCVLTEADFLLETPPGEFKFIAGNPPFAIFRNLPEFFKAAYGGVLHQHVRSDILHAFLDRCVSMIPPSGGVVGMVTSDRWLLNTTASHLRKRLATRVAIKHVTRLDASTAFYRPKNRRKGTPPRIHPVSVVLAPSAPGMLPITAKPMSPDGALDNWSGPRLGDVANIRLAPWLGPDGIFTIPASLAGDLPGADLLPCVNSDNIHPVEDRLLPSTRVAIRTTAKCEPTGCVAEHIRGNLHKMPPRGLTGRWWLPPEPITLDLSEPALMIPRIARKVRCIPLPAGVLPIDHNIHVVSHRAGVTLSQIRIALESKIASDWITAFTPRLENGFLDMRLSMLRQIPVPI